MAFKEEDIKKSRELSENFVMFAMMILVTTIAVSLVAVPIYEKQKRKACGTVVEKSKDTLFVRNLKDTTRYYTFTRQDHLEYIPQYFDYIASGDMLKFYVQSCDGTKINNITEINSKDVAKFVRLKREQQRNDSIRSRILQNQKVK
ncbi:MAG: hypothetical protein UIC65_03430 [Alphaproteobacteria bacterium]|nr:hypothetical protein [Alphaproteobacteria bacterium]